MRRSGRIPKEIPVLLIGSDLSGRVFSEHTKTVLLSLHGAGLLSRHKLSPEQELVLRWPERNKETDIRVVGQIGEDCGIYTYGVAFPDHVPNFWEMDFPPPSPIERELGLLTLVCIACQSVDKIDNTSPEADVCATNNGVLRYCKRCGTSTVWKVGQPGASNFATQLRAVSPPAPTLRPDPTPASSHSRTQQPRSVPPSPYSATPPVDLIPRGLPVPQKSPCPSSSWPSQVSKSSPTPSPSPTTSVATLPASPSGTPEQKPATPLVNRRKYPRVKVNYIALVRHPDRGEEFVQCEDVSRGGLRFKSRVRYFEQTVIDVAAPYSSGQPAIFLPARIVYAQELPEQKLFRYGLQYLRDERPRGAF